MWGGGGWGGEGGGGGGGGGGVGGRGGYMAINHKGGIETKRLCVPHQSFTMTHIRDRKINKALRCWSGLCVCVCAGVRVCRCVCVCVRVCVQLAVQQGKPALSPHTSLTGTTQFGD